MRVDLKKAEAMANTLEAQNMNEQAKMIRDLVSRTRELLTGLGRIRHESRNHQNAVTIAQQTIGGDPQARIYTQEELEQGLSG